MFFTEAKKTKLGKCWIVSFVRRRLRELPSLARVYETRVSLRLLSRLVIKPVVLGARIKHLHTFSIQHSFSLNQKNLLTLKLHRCLRPRTSWDPIGRLVWLMNIHQQADGRVSGGRCMLIKWRRVSDGRTLSLPLIKPFPEWAGLIVHCSVKPPTFEQGELKPTAGHRPA